MRLFPVLLLSAFAALSASAQHAELSQIQTVYLLPMGNGFDQYLANQLTRLGPFQVTADPQVADAIFTDRLGQVFEARLEELFPAPSEQPKEGESEREAKAARPETGRTVPPSTFARGKGTVFLVERKGRRVVWSTFEPARQTTPEALNNSAERVVRQLRRSLGAK